MKKLLSITLSLMLFLSVIPLGTITASAAITGTTGGFTSDANGSYTSVYGANKLAGTTVIASVTDAGNEINSLQLKPNLSILTDGTNNAINQIQTTVEVGAVGDYTQTADYLDILFTATAPIENIEKFLIAWDSPSRVTNYNDGTIATSMHYAIFAGNSIDTLYAKSLCEYQSSSRNGNEHIINLSSANLTNIKYFAVRIYELPLWGSCIIPSEIALYGTAKNTNTNTFIKQKIGNIDLGPYALKGAVIEVLGYEIPLLDIEANLTLNLTDNLKVVVDNDKSIQVLLGFDEGASANIQGANKSDTYWSDSYKEVKSMYQQLTNKKVDTTRLWNKFSSMRGKLKKFNANMVVDVNASLAGYVEFKYTSSGYKFSEGGIIAAFSAGTSIRSYYGPCYVALGIEAGIDGSLAFTNENNKINPTITVSPNFTLSLGGGIGTRNTYAQIDAYGTLSAIIATDKEEPFSAGLDIGARWMGYIMGKELFSGSKSFSSVELYPNFGDSWETASVMMLTPEIDVSDVDVYYDLLDSSEYISRNYLTAPYSIKRNSTYSNACFLKENLYPLNAAEIVKFDNNNMLLIWIDDLGTKTSENLGSLMYSYFDGSTWSEPAVIFEDGTSNDMPTVYSDGTNAYIVWQKANQVFDESIATSDSLGYYDLYETTFKSDTLTFTDVVNIKSEENSVFEFNPVVYGNDGAYKVAWIENSVNNVYQMSGENKIKIASFDKLNNLVEVETIATTSNMFTDIAINEEVVYYSILESESNNLYCYKEDVDILASGINAFDYENDKLFYSDSNGFYSYDGTNTVQYSNITSLDDFVISSNGTDYVLFTTVLNEDFSKTLYYSKLAAEAKDWTNLEIYSSVGKYIRDYTPIMLSDGNIKVAVNYYDEESEMAALVVENCTNNIDVAVTYVDFDETQLESGTTELSIGLQNNSSLSVDKFIVEISDSTETIFTTTIEKSLSAFEEIELNLNFALPANYESEVYTVKVLPVDFIELDESNNASLTTIECIHTMEWVMVYPPTISDGKESYRCAKCGEISEERTIPHLKFSGASLSLHHNLSINYKVDKALFDEVGYESPYVVFELNGVKTTVRKYTIDGDRYVFTFLNIAPNQMNDTISATLYATYNGVEYSSNTREYSVAEYCYNKLEDCADDTYAELRTLLVDLLNYGAETQLYTNYKTDDLVTANLTAEQLLWGTSEDPVLENSLNTKYETVENPKVKWKGARLTLDNSVAMRFKFTADSIEGLKVKIKSSTGEWTIPSNKFTKEDGFYYVYFNGLSAGQMSEKVYLTVYEGDTAVSNTVCYSIESYAYEKQNSEIEYLSSLVKAMMKYGNSAYAYVN